MTGAGRLESRSVQPPPPLTAGAAASVLEEKSWPRGAGRGCSPWRRLSQLRSPTSPPLGRRLSRYVGMGALGLYDCFFRTILCGIYDAFFIRIRVRT